MTINNHNINLRIIGKIANDVYYESRQYGPLKKLKRSYFIPIQPGTFLQSQRWLLFSAGVREWHFKSSADKKQLDGQCSHQGLCMSGFNFFLRQVLKGEIKMIQRILSGTAGLIDGYNFITIPEVDLTKSFLSYNSYMTNVDTSNNYLYGVMSAVIASSTSIVVLAKDEASRGGLSFAWQIIEFV